MAGKKYNWTQKYQNVNSFIKYALQYIYNMLQYKFILPHHQIKLHNEIHSTAQNCTTKLNNYDGFGLCSECNTRT